jgi:hypothetical protein
MSPSSLAKAIDDLIRDADAAYLIAITRVQDRLYNQVVTVLKDLELDNDGYILQNAANRKIISRANDKISEIFNSGLYTNAVSNYINIIPYVDSLNVQYFNGISEGFKPNRLFLKSLQTDTIATVEKYILRDGLQSQVIGPLSQIMNQNVNSGGQFSGFLDQIRNYVQGNDQVEGRAMRYTRTYLMDTLFTYSRTFQQSITNDLGLEFYLYSGGLIETSRPFCDERAGKYFHHKEIELWASLDWAGKKQGTTESSIFLFAGGWNCNHQLIPVSTLVVPKEVIERQ